MSDVLPSVNEAELLEIAKWQVVYETEDRVKHLRLQLRNYEEHAVKSLKDLNLEREKHGKSKLVSLGFSAKEDYQKP